MEHLAASRSGFDPRRGSQKDIADHEQPRLLNPLPPTRPSAPAGEGGQEGWGAQLGTSQGQGALTAAQCRRYRPPQQRPRPRRPL